MKSRSDRSRTKRGRGSGFPASVLAWWRANWQWTFWFLLIPVLAFALGQFFLPTATAPRNGLGDDLENRPATGSDTNYRDLRWAALIPAGWEPEGIFTDKKLLALGDSDAGATRALEDLRKAWDEAPVNKQVDGERIRIAGYVVPLERAQDRIVQFLLVPYFGACIHVPPPPANPLILVTSDVPMKDIRAMDAVWVIGVLSIARSDESLTQNRRTPLGVAGYVMNTAKVTSYRNAWW